MKTGLALFSLTAFAALLLVSIWAASQISIVPVIADLWANPASGNHPWWVATLLDANFGFLWFWLWAQYKETSWVARIAWLVAFLTLGNMGMAAYMLLQLYRLPKGATIDDLLLRPVVSVGEPGAVTESWWRRRFVAPIVQQLRQGTTPKLIAITLAAGAVFGLFPIFGATTFLCGVVGVAFRLNQPLIQTVNYLLSPVHVLMLLPFYRAGESLFRQEHVPIVSLTALTERFWASPLQFCIDYGMVALYGITVWLLVSPLIFVLVYALVARPVRMLAAAKASLRAPRVPAD